MDDRASFHRSLGERIREAREKTGATQDDLARVVGLSRTSVTNIERGRQGVQAYLLVKIARTLGLTVQQLLPVAECLQTPPDQLKEIMDPEKRRWAERVIGITSQEEGRNGS